MSVTGRMPRPPWGWAAPSILGAVVFFLLPLGWIVVSSLQRSNLGGSATWAGVHTLAGVLGAPSWGQAAGYTLALAVVIVPAELALGVVLGAALARTRRPLAAQLALLVPWAVSPLIAGVILRWITAPSEGVLAHLAGRRLDALATPDAVPVIAAIAVLWQSVGFTALCYAAALRAVPPELRDAGRLDGASAAGILLHIELPFLRRMTLFLAVAGIGGVFGLYDVFVALPQGPSPTLAQLMVQKVWQEFDLGAGAAMALGTMALLGAVLALVAVAARRRA